MRERAGEMEAAGQKRQDIVAQFSEEYDLRRSYILRILEDRRKSREKPWSKGIEECVVLCPDKSFSGPVS